MLQVARLAPRLLGESSELVSRFLHSRMSPDGGFMDRSGESDLYYTVFGLEGLIALRADLPSASVVEYLRRFGDGEGLDFIHLTCLARCWAALPPDFRARAPREGMLERMESFRTPDGGYDVEPGSESGTVYGCFMALGGYQDLEAEVPAAGALVECVEGLRAADGGYANQADVPAGLTPSTAAAATLLRALGRPVPPELAPWLLERCLPAGGFFATPFAPLPDLLSTATALHALAGTQADLNPIKEPCLDFVDSLWTNAGGFYAHWEDDAVDCEYTYYGLLALGHLAV